MLKSGVIPAFSPSAIQASLQTSTVHVPHRATGAAMSLTKKSDVKNDPFSRNRSEIHLHRSSSQPDATGFSGGQSDSISSNAAEKTRNVQTSSGPELVPTQDQSDSSHTVTLPDSKSAQA
jgi:hypothetical protein